MVMSYQYQGCHINIRDDMVMSYQCWDDNHINGGEYMVEGIIMSRMGNGNDDNLGLDDRDDTVANGGGYMVDTW